MMTPRDDSQ